MTDEAKPQQPTHFVIAGGNLASRHTSIEDARTAGIAQAKGGKSVTIAALVETITPNTGVTITLADGTTSQAQ